MAISVDTIYQRVLAIANKEQRGYITPQEFNLLANQAQMSIFQSYFFDKNARERLEPIVNPETDETNITELIDRKLSPFKESLPVTSGHTFPATTTVGGVAIDIFQYGRVFFNDQVCRKVTINEAERLKKSVRHMIDTDPIYADNRVTGRDIVVYAGSTTEKTSNVTVECFRVPKTVNWAYTVVNNQALYNASASDLQDFELHKVEGGLLVFKILELSGVIINNPDVASLGSTKATQVEQKVKQ
mgnify:FL=1|jgi:hypothetical protein|tara:strand:+ start:832 stop:1563 length:732 start_codon:yes stop_codon:yes gene_type:complete